MFKSENEYYRIEICDPFLEKLLNSKDFGKIETMTVDEDQIRVRFGSYPQTKVNDKSLVTAILVKGGIKEILANPTAIKDKCHRIKKGYYIDIDYGDQKYRALLSFDESRTISVSCFKFEPIDWTVYLNVRETYSIVPDKILDCIPFNESGFDIANVTYLSCSARKWINNVFFADAFDSEYSKYVMTVTSSLADEKGNSTYYDKVEILPIEEYEKITSLGATDYAVALGVGIFPEMTRSVKNSFVLGANSETYPKTLPIGIRPAIRITKIAGAMYKYSK